MKVYFRKSGDSWLMSRFYDGNMIYNFTGEQHQHIHKKIKEIFPSAIFISERNNNRVTFTDTADSDFFLLWIDEHGVEI